MIIYEQLFWRVTPTATGIENFSAKMAKCSKNSKLVFPHNSENSTFLKRGGLGPENTIQNVFISDDHPTDYWVPRHPRITVNDHLFNENIL